MKDVKEAKENVTVWASSLLPETPSGRLAMVGDLQDTGMLTKDQALVLLDSPDTSKFLSSEGSRLKAIDLLLDRAVESGKKPPYYPALGLDLYLDRAKKLFAEMIVEEAPADKLSILEACITELEGKVSKQTAIGDALNQITQGQGPTTQQTRDPNAGRSQTY